MRPIKFRAWDIEGKCWIPLPLCIIDHEGELCTWDENESRYLKETIPHIVVWFTGLHDKNGKEIWEGDILGGGLKDDFKTRAVIGTVVFEDGMFMVDDSPLFEYVKWWVRHFKMGEVLGNIYENPELLLEAE